MVRNTILFTVRGFLAPRPTPRLEGYPYSTVRDCMFNISAATLHIAGRSSIHNLRTRHAVVTGTHLSSTHPLLILHLLQHRCQNFDWEERARSLKFSPSLVGIPAGVRTGYLQKHFRYTKQVEGILGLLLVCWLCVWALDR